MKKKPATVEDVARRAGVSRQTVSNVVNKSRPVREETAQRVYEAIKELDYRPNLGARRLRTSRSQTIGVRLQRYAGGISGVVLDRFLHGLTSVAAEHGYRIVLYAAESAEEELERISALFSSQEIDSVVLTGTHKDDPRPAQLKKMGVGHVAFGRWWATNSGEFPWVDVDGAAGIKMATEHIISTTSKQPMFVGWPSDGATGDDRRNGWLTTVQAHRLPVPDLEVAAPDELHAARKALRQAFAGGLPEGVGGVVCASDLLAVATKLELEAHGYRDVLITGFDNTPTTQVLGISSVEQRPERVAEEVFAMIFNPDGPRQLLLQPQLIVR